MQEGVVFSLKQVELARYLHDPEFLDDLAHRIYEKDSKRITDLAHFKLSLKHCDKNLFI